MSRPSFATAIVALRTRDPRFPWIGPTPDEADAADALEVFQDHHQPADDQAGPDGHWGACTGCGDPWPCPAWVDGEQLALLWLGRAMDRAAAHAQAVMDTPRQVAA